MDRRGADSLHHEPQVGVSFKRTCHSGILLFYISTFPDSAGREYSALAVSQLSADSTASFQGSGQHHHGTVKLCVMQI